MYFIKLIIFTIIFKFLACFGIEADSNKLSTSEMLSVSAKDAIANTACVYKVKAG
jgi:hypothetical protein